MIRMESKKSLHMVLKGLYKGERRRKSSLEGNPGTWEAEFVLIADLPF